MKRAGLLEINADVGEGVPSDADLMPFLDSCSIACGGHAGSPTSIQTTLLLAKEYRVSAGPHPGYPDPEHFGRRVLPIGRQALYQSIVDQLTTYTKISEALGVEVHHVKFHGALYHEANQNEEMALFLWECLNQCLAPTKIYLPPNSAMRASIQAGWEVWTEAFLDRNYLADLSLVPRLEPEASIKTVAQLLERYEHLQVERAVCTMDGQMLGLEAQTACLHGDGPMAIAFARAILLKRKQA